MTTKSHLLSMGTLLQAAYLFRAEYGLATIAQRCNVPEDTILARLDDIKRIAAEINGS